MANYLQLSTTNGMFSIRSMLLSSYSSTCDETQKQSTEATERTICQTFCCYLIARSHAKYAESDTGIATPSVCPTHAGVVSKQPIMPSKFFRPT